MKLVDIKNFLKEHIDCENWYLGKIDANKDFCVGLYPTAPSLPIIAIGGINNSSYATKAVSILVHWGNSFSIAEAKAQELYNLLFSVPQIIGEKEIIKIDFRTAEPVGIGTDEKGIYEFVINFIIYYKKGN